MDRQQAAAWADRIAANTDALRYHADDRTIVKASRMLWELASHAWAELWGLDSLPAQHPETGLAIAADKDGLLVVADPRRGFAVRELAGYATATLDEETLVRDPRLERGTLETLRPHPTLPQLLWWCPSPAGPQWQVARVTRVVATV